MTIALVNRIINYFVVLSTLFNIGDYIYTEASSPRVPGDRFVIGNGPYTSGNTICFSFWYHMYGEGMGSLLLNDYDNTLLRFDGDHGNIWRKASITIAAGPHLVIYNIDIKQINTLSY